MNYTPIYQKRKDNFENLDYCVLLKDSEGNIYQDFVEYNDTKQDVIIARFVTEELAKKFIEKINECNKEKVS